MQFAEKIPIDKDHSPEDILEAYHKEMVARHLFLRLQTLYGMGDENWDGYGPDDPWMLPISAQLEPVDFLPDFFGEFLFQDVVAMPFPDDLTDLDKDGFVALFLQESVKMIMLFSAEEIMTSEAVGRVAVAKTLNQRNPTAHARRTENLFHTAALAIQGGLETMIAEAGNGTEDGPEKVRQFLLTNDENYSIHNMNRLMMLNMHRLQENPAKLQAPDYHLIASLFSQLDAMAMGSALLVKYGPELESNFDEEGSINYQNADFLQYLIRTARDRALVHIAECRNLDIPCPTPIADFQYAETHRDDNDVDKLHDVVQRYWRASLGAKALIMAFGQ